MKRRTRSWILTILIVLALSAMQVVPVLADDEAPPPPAATEVAPPAEGPGPEVLPAEQAPAATAEIPAERPAKEKPVAKETVRTREMPGEILAQVPEGTEVVVLDENGEAVPLATQQAAEIVKQGDPIWCPAGVAPRPGIGGCTASQNSFNDPDGAGPLTGLINLLNNKTQAGTIWILYNYVGTLGLEGGAVTLNGGDLGSTANYALTIKGGWTGASTGAISSTSDSIFNVPLNIINWNANITLSDIEIASASGTDALKIITTKDINLTRVKSHNNTGTGANLYNGVPTGTGKVTIASSDFSENGGSYGLYVLSNGAIKLTSVTTNQNTSNNGAWLSNSSSLLPQGITLTASSFNGNTYHGLTVFSKGAILATDLTTNDNGGNGAALNNTTGTASVTLKGTNVFSGNYGTGLNITSHGAIVLNNILANANDGNGGGAILDNASSTTPQNITLTGSNQFKYNYNTGLNITSKGLVTLNNINASGSIQKTGMFVDTCIASATCTGSALGGIRLTGTNIFNDNYDTGLRLSSAGTMTLNSITASGNGITGAGGYGAYLDNSAVVAPKTITLTGTNVFDDNFTTGLFINANGNIIVNNLTVRDTRGNPADTNITGNGAYIENSGFGTVVSNVTLTGSNVFSGNYGNGLEVHTDGTITLANITAAGNGTGGISGRSYGALLANNAGNTRGITISGTNRFDSNYASGLYITSDGVVKLNSITANGSLNGSGIDVYTTFNSTTLAALILTGTNTFNDNFSRGVNAVIGGIITINNLNASRNGEIGAYIDNTGSGPLTPRNITLTGSSTFASNNSNGMEIITYGGVSLANITATGNGISSVYQDGVYINNYNSGTPARNVILTGINTFSSNLGFGLELYASGAIIASSLTANNNGSASGDMGVNLFNDYPGAGKVTLSGTNTFNGNYEIGLSITSRGAITVSNLRASGNGNGVSGSGAILNNSANGVNVGVSLTGSVLVSNNHYAGLFVQSAGLISAANVTATGNLNSSGVFFNNVIGTSTAGVTLTGINVFSGNYANGLDITSRGAVNLLATRITASNNTNGSGLFITTLNTITLSNVTANANGNFGALITNSTATTAKAVKLNGTNTFSSNTATGLSIQSFGAVTINNLTTNHNAGGWGVQINNGATGVNGAVTLTGYTYASENSAGGIRISNSGTVSLTKITADSNSGDGLYVNTTGSTILTCGSFTSNTGDGAELHASVVKLTGVFASGNGGLNINSATTPVIVRNCPLP